MVVSSHSHSSHPHSSHRNWAQAGLSSFAIASALPTAMDSRQMAELFDKVEEGSWDASTHATPELTTIRNATGESLLIVAARVGNLEAVKQLAQFDIEYLDDTDNDGWTALLNASNAGYYDIAKILIDYGASVDLPDALGWTALMWAAYKNHVEVAELLLNNRAHVNVMGDDDCLTPLIIASGRGFTTMVEKLIAAEAQYSSTALMMATRGNYVGVVDLLLTREPNVNVTDNNGLSALSMAAREGYGDICQSLINGDAYVNHIDRFGNPILISAVRSGNISIVKMILDKFADVNCRDSEGRTPLHLAIDKQFTDIAYLLLEKRPNLEIKNKDGETPLLRAAKLRHVQLCMYLMNAGAKLSATDNCGENALHIALKARSRRLTQALLTNPSDSRLLYRPNKLGETPYSIDQRNQQPILPLIFGPIDAEQHMDTMMGYDVYSNVLADIVCEPSLSLPLTIGLYAKWGSGKSILLSKLKESMHSFSRSWLEGASLRLSFLTFFKMLVVCVLCTLVLTTISAILRSIPLYITIWIVGILLYVALTATLILVYYGSETKGWASAIRLADFSARFFCHLRLIFNLIFFYAPLHSDDSSSNASNPVSFLFADYHRLSSIGGEQALAKIVCTLFEAAESHFGVLPVRLFCALRSPYPAHSMYRLHCGIPLLVFFAVALFLFVLFNIFMTIWLFSDRTNDYTVYLIISLVLLLFFLLLSLYPIFLSIRFSWTNVPRRRVNAAARNVHKLRFEGLMQKLQTEVDLLADMIRTLDAFTRSQTRLVVVVDGLDNCEQERMVQTLDALELLFSARKQRPFITIIAVDPHIIISAINHNMHSALTGRNSIILLFHFLQKFSFSGTELTGHDYLKNIVNMPFYLHNSALRQLQAKLKEKRESLADWKERFRRQETFHGSHLSLANIDGRNSRKSQVNPQSAMNLGGLVTRNVSEGILGEDYFSNMNPRAMRRIVNALTLTGRLMRAFEIDFSWLSLGHWVSLLEQWPSRMCWLIDRASEVSNNGLLLFEVYYQLKDHIPKDDPLIALDRNPDNFEAFLNSKAIPMQEKLTVGHVKKFVPCTSNLDPYLRKLIRERSKGLGEIERHMGTTGMAVPQNAKLLFTDEKVWTTVCTPLAEMKLEGICSLLRRLDLPPTSIDQILAKFRQFNLNGLVLISCTLNELRDALQLSLGDWTIVRLFIETLKAFGPNMPGVRVDKRKALTLHEEEEHEDEEDVIRETAPLLTEGMQGVQPAGGSFSQTGPGPLLQQAAAAEQRRRSVAMASELNEDHKWLMESLSGMDLTETEGDIGPLSSSTAPSVRFDDDIQELDEVGIAQPTGIDENDAASDADSTQSRYDSRENLLDLDRQDTEATNALTHKDSNSSNHRSELMANLRNDSIHSGHSGHSGADSTDGSGKEQLTVQRKPSGTEQRQLNALFAQATYEEPSKQQQP
ncbi:hypothetical protein WR25_13293 [Diploscapter pachys]|uniref:Uncharacterized protein n=1 Tax=Diploscapter pachys TaxID=2018661 RepID=A0A2A2JRH2_9BILA|nr:hypothetical protein WR25_13293 [Diploscapter pachys]